MNKYLILFQKAFIKSIAFRSEISVWLILDFLPTLTLLFMWQSIYQDKNAINGYTLSQICYYYLISVIVEAFTSAHFQAWRVEQIRTGKIDYFLIRPLSFLHEIVLVHLGGKCFYMLFSLPVFAALFFLITHYFHLPALAVQPTQIIVFLFLLFMGLIVQTLVGLIIVMLGFWFEGADGLDHFREIIFTLFSGVMIPIQLMPNWLRTIVNMLPLKYSFAVPIEVMLGKRFIDLSDIMYLFSFVLFLLAAVWLIWQQAKKQYSSAGG